MNELLEYFTELFTQNTLGTSQVMFCKWQNEDTDSATLISVCKMVQKRYKLETKAERKQFLDAAKLFISNKSKEEKAKNDRLAARDKKLQASSGTVSYTIHMHDKRYESTNDIDIKMLRDIYYSIDENQEYNFYIKDYKYDNLFTKIIMANSERTTIEQIQLAFSQCVSIKGKRADVALEGKWSKLLDSACQNIFTELRKWDDGSGNETSVYDTIDANLPLYAVNNLINIVAHKNTESDEPFHTDVNIVRKSKSPLQVSVYEYLSHVIKFVTKDPDKKIEPPKTYSCVPGESTLFYFPLDEYMSTVKEIPTPAWEEFSERYTADEWEVFKAFTFGIFNSRNKSRQALYQYDKGFTGKSTYQAMLSSKLSNGLISAVQKDSLNNQFGLAKIWNSRLVMIGDNKNPNIIRSEKIHMALGGDLCEVEIKSKSSFSYRLNCKIIINGNVMPEIDPHANHERTRLILLKPTLTDSIKKRICVLDDKGDVELDVMENPMFIGDPGFEGRLITEFDSFMLQCKRSYEKLCPNDGNYNIPTSVVKNLYELESEEQLSYDEFFQHYLELDPKAKVGKKDLKMIWRKQSENYGLDKGNMGFKNLITYMSNRYGVEDIRTTVDGARIMAFEGVKMRKRSAPALPNGGGKSVIV